MYHSFNPDATIADEIAYLTEMLGKIAAWQTHTDFLFDGNEMSETVVNIASLQCHEIEFQIAALREQLELEAAS